MSTPASAAPLAPAKRGSLEPWIKDEITYYKHQVEGVRLGAKMRSFILGDDMGLGKTIQTLTIFAVDVVRGWAQTAIIVTPPSLKTNWAAEIEKFTRFQYIVLDGTPEKRTEQLFDFLCMEGPKLLIVNYEQLDIHKDTLDSWAKNWSWDFGVFDEAHMVKNALAKRTKAFLELRTRRSLLLTGTPMLNDVPDLWPMLHRIDSDRFPDFFRFVNRYCVYGGFQRRQIVGIKNEKELSEHVSTRMIRRLKKDVLDLPEVQIIKRYVDMHPQQREVYDMVYDDFTLVNLEGEEEYIKDAVVRFIRCKQICGTTFPFTGEDFSAKLDLATLDDIELLRSGEKIVVFTQFRDMQNCYIDRMSGTGVPIFSISGDTPPIDRPGVAKEWESTEGPAVFVAMLQVAAVGLNLTAARHGSFLDKLFTPGMNQQAIDRLHRIGQGKQPVQIREYLVRKSVENRVERILEAKKEKIDLIIKTDPMWKKTLLRMVLEAGDD